MDRDIRILRLSTMAAAILMPVTSFAQAPPQSQAPVSPKAEQTDPEACANSETHATVGQGVQMQKSSDSNLSDRLARSDGVICPPDHIDPDIKAVTPPGGPMPVIPPPGSPGGDPNVRPK